VDGHRRYAEDPDPQWYSEPAPYESPVPEQRPDDDYRRPEPRPVDEVRYPLTGGVDSLAPPSAPFPGGFADTYPRPAAFAADDPLTSGAIPGGYGRTPIDEPSGPRPALEAIRVPVRGPEYPAVRPGAASDVSTTTTGAIPAQRTPETGGPQTGAPQGGGTTYPSAPSGPAYPEPTTFVPPVGVRTADGPPPGDGVYRTRRPVSAVLIAIVTAVLMVPVVRLLLDAALAEQPAAGQIVPSVLLTLGLPLTGIGLFAVAGLGRAPDRAAWSRPPVGYLAVGLILLVAAALATAG
jgi:hypothetical protein